MTMPVVILMSHRVADLASDPWGLAVSPAHFAQHVEVLRRYARPVTLAHAVERLERGGVSMDTVVVTFDDGYADNLHTAKSILERHDVPAVVFVASGYMASGHEFWWDTLETILLGPTTLPGAMHVDIGGHTAKWCLDEGRFYSAEARRSDARGRATGCGRPSSRKELYRAVHSMLLPLDEEERTAALANIAAWVGVSITDRESHRCLSAENVAALANGGLIEIGFHFVSHSLLPALRESRQHEEIRQSKTQLEEVVGHAITAFAYPYGCYTAETRARVREERFTAACGSRPGLVTNQTDVASLPRIRVEDWTSEGLARVLSGSFAPFA